MLSLFGKRHPSKGTSMKSIIEMAREAGLFTHKEVQPELEAFAALVREDEREACAAKAEQVGQYKNHIGIAAAIRARGQA
jgi:hypothetical protein